MKSRILSTALALSLLATVIVAFPGNAAVIYTGSVQTTDGGGTPKDTFFVGDPVYVNVELRDNIGPFAGSVTVQLVRTTDSTVVSSFIRTTNNPDVGWYNSSGAGVWLGTGGVFPGGFTGNVMTCDVVEWYGGNVVARHPITVQAVGLTLQPGSDMFNPYYPGQTVSISLVTTHIADGFYVQIVNASWATLFNITNQVTWTGQWNYQWTIPADFPDGHFFINVNAANTNITWHSDDLWVQKYVLRVSSDRMYYLIGETARINYAVFDASLGTPYSGVVITYSATWLDLVGNQTWENATLPFTAGTQEFTLGPSVNISSNVLITYWANESGTARSYQAFLTLYTGLLSGSLSVGAGPYQPGDLVVVTAGALAGFSNLPGASVVLTVEQNGTPIAEYGAANLTTDVLGSVTHTFRLATSAMQGSYIVNVTISKQGQSVNRMGVFAVTWSGQLLMKFDKDSYYGGDTIHVTFRTIWNGEEMTGLSVAYYATVSYGILTTGNVTGNEAEIAIPADYYGFIVVSASVNVNGNIFDYALAANVNVASIVLTTDQDHYRQGNTVVFHFDIVTSLTAGNLMYEITDHEGVTVKTDSPAFTKSGSFSYQVPSDNPSTSYTARMVMTTDSGSYLSATRTVTIMDNYELQIWLGKSGYASGEYKPGQTVKVHYVINTYESELPVYRITLETSLDPIAQSYLVTETSGVLDYKIPDTAPTMLFFMGGTLYNGLTGVDISETGEMLFMVNSELGAWDRSIGGMSAIDFTILVLIVIMILLLIIVPLLKGRMGGPKPVKVVEATPPAPPPSP